MEAWMQKENNIIRDNLEVIPEDVYVGEEDAQEEQIEKPKEIKKMQTYDKYDMAYMASRNV
jgi:hypothetical protein